MPTIEKRCSFCRHMLSREEIESGTHPCLAHHDGAYVMEIKYPVFWCGTIESILDHSDPALIKITHPSTASNLYLRISREGLRLAEERGIALNPGNVFRFTASIDDDQTVTNIEAT